MRTCESPWDSNVAPMSWLVQRDVDGAGESAETVRDGEMSPWRYEIAHSEARLDPSELARLETGLARTLGDDD